MSLSSVQQSEIKVRARLLLLRDVRERVSARLLASEGLLAISGLQRHHSDFSLHLRTVSSHCAPPYVSIPIGLGTILPHFNAIISIQIFFLQIRSHSEVVAG